MGMPSLKLISKTKRWAKKNKEEFLYMQKCMASSSETYTLNAALRKYLVGALLALKDAGVTEFKVNFQGNRVCNVDEELKDLDDMVKEGLIAKNV